jgi:hypothetical protein
VSLRREPTGNNPVGRISTEIIKGMITVDSSGVMVDIQPSAGIVDSRGRLVVIIQMDGNSTVIIKGGNHY